MPRLFFVLAAVALTQSAAAQTPRPPDAKVVVRLSREFLRELVKRPVKRDFDIEQEVLGAQVTGTAHLEGVFEVRLHRADGNVSFDLLVHGDVQSQTVATRRPVEVYSHGRTEFEACQRVVYDGMTFAREAIDVEALHRSTVDGIGAPPGLRGVVVRAIARPQIRRSQPQGNRIAEDQTRTKVAESIDPETKKLVDTLNEVAPVVRRAKEAAKEFLAKKHPELKQWQTHRASTEKHLLSSMGPAGHRIPERVAHAETTSAPLEIWIHDPGAKELLTKAEMLRKQFGGAVRSRLKEVAPEALPFLESNVHAATIDGWLVFRLGEGMLTKARKD